MIQKKTSGVTLIELLVSMVIMGIIISLVLGSAWTMVKTQDQAAHFRNLQQEIHFSMSRISDLIRTYGIDYLNNDDLLNPVQELTLNGKIYGSDPIVLEIKSSGNREKSLFINDSPLLSTLVKVKEIGIDTLGEFTVSPKGDPFTNYGNPEMQIQPRVEIFLVLQDIKYPHLEIPIQTTISSRKYSP